MGAKLRLHLNAKGIQKAIHAQINRGQMEFILLQMVEYVLRVATITNK